MGKIKKNDDKSSLIKVIIIMLLMAMLAMVVVLAKSMHVKTMLYRNYLESKAINKLIIEDNIIYTGYQQDGQKYTVIEDDPRMVFSGEKMVITDIDIKFTDKLKNNMNVQVYYDINNTGFSEEHSKKITAVEDCESVDIEIYQKDVTSIRIDIGDLSGETFYLKNISVNENLHKRTIVQQLREAVRELPWGKVLCRWELLAVALCFIGLHLCINIKKLYAYLFKKRWIIAGLILMFLVVNKFNGESIAIYDNIIQPGEGSEYTQPIYGEIRPIRSDEFVVETPNKMASMHNEQYGKYNEVSRGTKTLNSINGVYIGYSTLGRNPFQYTYKILPAEYAYSFCWYAPIILCFMFALELFYIISAGNAMIAVTGACIEILSPFYLWWAFPGVLLGAQGAIVCAYYFIQTNKRYKQILFGCGVAILFANYVLGLYPAWMVPMGFIALSCLVWIVHENWNKIKQWKLMDWLIVFGVAVFSVSLIVSYLIQNFEYIQAITNTVYPGKRSENGGFALNKLFYYGQAYLYTYKEVGNTSEASTVFSLFPIPMILAGYTWIKEKKKNWLTGLLLMMSMIFLVYITIGLPEIVAKVTLLNFSTPIRMADMMGIIQIYFIVIFLSREEKWKEFPIWGKIVLVVMTPIMSLYFCKKMYPQYLSIKWMIISFIIISGLAILLLWKENKWCGKLFCICICVFSIISSISIRPITRGLDAITSKPVSKKINEIVAEDSDAKWVGYSKSICVPSFLIANGAPTINSTNIYPNLELWEALDEKGKYEQIYNRYAHIIVKFTEQETSFSVGVTEDLIELNLSYKDLRKTGVKYIFALEELDINNKYLSFRQIYNENNAYIYHVDYK